MFKLFKDKLKGALSIFSKKVEQDSKTEEIEVDKPTEKTKKELEKADHKEQKTEAKKDDKKEAQKQEDRKEEERKKEEDRRREEAKKEEERKKKAEERRHEEEKEERKQEEKKREERKEEQRKEEARRKEQERKDAERKEEERKELQKHKEQKKESHHADQEARNEAERKAAEERRKEEQRLEEERNAAKEEQRKKEESERIEKREEQIEEERKRTEKQSKKKTVPPTEVAITYFVHGTTKDNEENRSSGQSQIGLSKLGIRQSEELKKQVYHDFDIIISSDLKRAIDSAKITWPDKQIITDKRLRECNYGELTGHKEQELEKYEKKHDLTTTPFPKGESYSDVEERIRLFLNDLYQKYQGKHVALVSHRFTQLSIEVLLQDKTWKQVNEDDWRKKEPKEWKPGWDYTLTKEITKKEPEKKGGFFSKIFGKKEEPKEEKAKEERPEKKEHIHKTIEIEETKRQVIEKHEEKPRKEETKEGEKEEIPEEKPEEKKGFFKKLTETFTTIQISDKRFEEIFWELEVVMLENSVAVEVIEKIKEDLRKELTSQKVSRKKVEDIILDTLKKSIKDLFAVPFVDILKESKKKKPYVIAFIGVNGSGKTTTLAKFAKMLQDNDKTMVIAAADTFRAAAIQQLEEHANNLGIKLIKQDYKSDPAAVAFDAIQHAKAKGIDIVLIDTAGRLHSNDNLMNELKKLIRVNQPDFKIFVGESITGNDCVEQARLFNEAVGIDGIILAKADVDEKGGAAISVSFITGKPILYLGIGQRYEDLKRFDPDIILENLGLE